MQTQNDKPEGTLRKVETLDGWRFKLAYEQKYGYHILSGLGLWARNLKNIQLGEAVIEAIALVHSDDVQQIIKHVKTEYKRLELSRFETPASKHNTIVFNAIRRLEGFRPRHSGKVEVWSKAA